MKYLGNYGADPYEWGAYYVWWDPPSHVGDRRIGTRMPLDIYATDLVAEVFQ